MIFLEYVGLRASLSAEKRKLQKCNFLFFIMLTNQLSESQRFAPEKCPQFVCNQQPDPCL